MKSISLVVLVALVAIGVNKQWNPGQEPGSVSVSISSANDHHLACRYAVNGFDNLDQSDRFIEELQRKAQSLEGAAQLERLGWAYANKASAGGDPGFAFLASRTVECMKLKQPENMSWQLLQAHLLIQQHRFIEAEEIATKLAAQRGGWFDYAVLGDALMERGNLDAAIDAYQSMVNLKPGPEAFGRIGHIRWLTGDIEGAIEMLDMAIRGTANDSGTAAGWWRTKMAFYLWQLGHADAALSLLDQVAIRNPGYKKQQVLRGQILVSQSRIAEALAVLEPLASARTNVNALWSYHEALIASGKSAEAASLTASMVQTGTRQDPQTLALFLATTGADLSMAQEIANAELRQRQDVFTLDLHAWTQLKRGQANAALGSIERALKSGIQHPRVWLHAAAIYRANGQDARAGEFIKKAWTMEQLLQPSEKNILSALDGRRTLEAIDPRLVSNSFLNHKEQYDEHSY